ncbi:hypothetical protein BCR44DRAFT_1426454 [Catenaria anguillulae PL171]|uniref:Abnormal spindle-like microcephaly-associated protein ASH domain-containing protein n=1 Tax=Catenaria anguillulae PL171 TaxID=765915 RepID=A0A1Y2HXN9_9FUNG|nr:hypothetical protein BCR44DRAFT_1426454 [Catenaria anguillulae PL171]
MVRTSFTLRPLLASTSSSSTSSLPITLSATSGTLEPMGGTMDIQATFHPPSPAHASRPLAARVPGMLTPIRLTFTATVPLVSVSLSPSAVAFGDVLIGSEPVNRVVHLENTSQVPAIVQLDGITKMSPVFSMVVADKEKAAQAGALVGVLTVEPRASVAVTVRFEPMAAGVYHREVRGKVENGEEFVLDLVGTGYTETQRPPSLELRHLEQYRHRRGIGLGLHGPEQVEHLIKLGTLTVAPSTGLLSWTSPTDMPSDDVLATLQSTPFASLDLASIDFGACTRYRYIEPRTLTLTNHSHTKVICTWLTSTASPAFLIEPAAAELAPKSTHVFRVSYRPEMDDAVDSAGYVCVVTPKTMRSFRLVGEDAAVTPSSMLQVGLVGNTLSPQIAMTKVEIASGATGTRIVLPAAVPNGPSVGRTFKVANVGDCPAHFSFTFPGTAAVAGLDAGQASAWKVVPMSGVVPVNGTVLVRAEFDLCAFTPDSTLPTKSSSGQITQPIVCMLNGTLSTSHALTLATQLAQPSLTGTLRNTSSVPVQFTWRMPANASGLLTIDPPAGVIQAHADQAFVVTYTPNDPGKVLVHAHVAYAAQAPTDAAYAGSERRLPVAIAGTCVGGALSAANAEVHLPPVLVNSAYITGSSEIVVVNPTQCTVAFHARIVQAVGFARNGRDPVEYALPQCAEDMYVVTTQDRVPPNSRRPVLVHLVLREQKEYLFKVQLALDPKAENWVDLCNVVATGVFPRLKVTGVASNVMGSYDLHQSCNIDAINAALQQGASKRVLAVTFPPRLVGSQDTTVDWVMQNTGPAPLQWSITTPRNPAAATAAVGSTNDQATSSGPESKCFTISHRSGSLAPGATQKLTLACKHMHAGTLEQAVQLQVKGGPECDGVIPLLFTSTTISPRHPHLFHAGNVQDFGPVPVDALEPVQRDMVVHNLGDAPLWFAVDTSALEEATAGNAGFAVFTCGRVNGNIPAGDKVVVPVTFHPIEAKAYAATLALTMVGGGAPIHVQLRGMGMPAQCVMAPTSLAQAAGLTKKCTALERASKVCLDFAEVVVKGLPMNAVCTRVVTLKNVGSAPTNYFGAGAGVSVHMFECLSGESMSALQNEVANHRAQHRSNLGSAGSDGGALVRTKSGGSAPGSASLGKYSSALPAIGTGAGTGVSCKISKCELTVHVETILDSTRSMYAPRPRHPYICAPLDSTDALDVGANNNKNGKADAIAHVMRASLDQVMAAVERDGTLDWIHGHVDWHMPPRPTMDGQQGGCPQTVGQDVLEGVLFGVLDELRRSG